MEPLYRHGDVLLQQVRSLPTTAAPRPGLVLVHGERTGHSHRIQEHDGRASLQLDGDQLYLTVSDTATLVHEEHAPIPLPAGVYRVWRQREYVPAREGRPAGFRPVAD